MDHASARANVIAQNQALLASLGLNAPVPKAEPGTSLKKRKAPAPASSKSQQPKRPKPKPIVVPRSTRQTRGAKKEEEEKLTPAEIEERRQAQEAIEEAEREAEHARRHGDRKIELLKSVTGASTDSRDLFDTLKGAASSISTSSAATASSPSKGSPSKSEQNGLNSLKTTLSTVRLRSLVKLVPERIYSILVHPSQEKDIAFVGDKTGIVAVWDATEAGKPLAQANGAIRETGGVDEDEDEEDVSEGKFWYWQAHARTVSCMRMSPTDSGSLYSGSYDCTIRKTDLATGLSTEVLDVGRFDEDDGLVHAFDFLPNGNEIWASDHRGGLLHRDLREPLNTVRRWRCDKDKIGCVSINPEHPNWAVTAHLKLDMRLWDLKKLVETPENDRNDLNSTVNACLRQYSHDYACSSAYFDKTGTKIVSTSYDNNLRVWDVNPQKGIIPDLSKPSSMTPHDCQVGRYVSVFKAQWAAAGPVPHFTVGNMSRTLDVFPGGGKPVGNARTALASLTGAEVTSVPAVTGAHPTRVGRYFGGTGAGKVQFFATD